MTEMETSTLKTITNVAASLPEPVQKGLFIALKELLGGLTRIPAAWLQRQAQAIEDTTAARSLVSAEFAKAVATQGIKNPLLLQAAAEIYLPSALKKAENRVRVAKLAYDYAAEADTSAANAQPPDEDWMNVFTRLAEDASSDRLQDLFARILAGEVVRPGSFSLATLRTVAELDKSIAEDFSLVWERSVGEGVDDTDDFGRGEWFSRWKRLVEVGLMSATRVARFPPECRPEFTGSALWRPISGGQTQLNVYFSAECRAQWNYIEFTRVGRQLGSILAAPDYEANIRNAGQRILSGNPEGIIHVELHTVGKPHEVLFALDRG